MGCGPLFHRPGSVNSRHLHGVEPRKQLGLPSPDSGDHTFEPHELPLGGVDLGVRGRGLSSEHVFDNDMV